MGAGGKGGGGEAAKVYDYYADLAGLVGVGMNYGDQLVGLEVNGALVWSGPVTYVQSAPGAGETTSNPYIFDVPGYGSARFYWGTDNQALHASSAMKSANNDFGQDHPPYKGQALIELVDFLLGREIQPAPDIKVFIRRAPDQALITNASADLDGDHQANPLAILAEILTHPRHGLMMDQARLNATSWRDAADELATDPDFYYITAAVSSQRTVHSLLLSIMAIADGYLRDAKEATGDPTIHAGIWTKGSPASVATITAADLQEPPKISFEDWEDIKTGAQISFVDRLRRFKETSAKEEDPVAWEIKDQESDLANLRRPEIRRAKQALAHAAEYCRLYCHPGTAKGTIAIRPTKAAAINPGDVFTLDIDPEPSGTEIHALVRCLRKTGGSPGPVRITWEQDRSSAPTIHTPEADLPPTHNAANAGTVDLRILPAPPALAGNKDDRWLAVSPRGNALQTGYDIHFSATTGGDFTRLGRQRYFALSGTVRTAWDDETSGPFNVDIDDSFSTSTAMLDQDPGADAAANDELLLIVFKVSASDHLQVGFLGSPILEFYSISAISGSLSNLSLTALRGRLGSPPQAAAVGDKVLIIRRSALEIFFHADFPSIREANGSGYFKAQPITPLVAADLATVTEKEIVFPSASNFAPTIDFSSPASTPGTHTFGTSSGGTLTFAGTVADADANLQSITITVRAGSGADTVVHSETFPIRGSKAFSVDIPFTTASTVYTVTVSATDSTNRGAQATWRVEVPAATPSTVAAAPVIQPEGGAEFYQEVQVTITNPEGAGGSIAYAIRSDYSDPTYPGDYTTAAAGQTVQFTLYQDALIFARITAAGKDPSPIVAEPFWKRQDLYL